MACPPEGTIYSRPLLARILNGRNGTANSRSLICWIIYFYLHLPQSMLKVNEAAFFAYPVTDMARARKFYEGVLGLKVSQEPTTVAWMEFDLGNTTLGLGSYDGWKPSEDGAMLA